MCETLGLVMYIKQTPSARGTLFKLANGMLDEQTRILVGQILNYLSSEHGDISKEDGFGNDYVAMCYQTQYKKYKSYEIINKKIEAVIFDYELPYELRVLYLDKEGITDPERIQIIDEEITTWRKLIQSRAREQVLKIFQNDHETANREAIWRGEKESKRKNECAERRSFYLYDDACRLKRKTDYMVYNDYVRDQNEFVATLMYLKGNELVKNLVLKIIEKLKKKPSSEINHKKYDDESILKTVWDVICVYWKDSTECPDEIVKNEIRRELEILSHTDKMVIWFFNTYRDDSCLEMYLDDKANRWTGYGIHINEEHAELYDEVADVVAQRIFWYAGKCKNERAEHYRTIKDTASDIVKYGYPREIYAIVQKMKEYAAAEEDKWYESLGGTYWVVKGASVDFYYKGMSYTIYPKEVGCKTHAFFEHMVIHEFEDELKAIGATNVRCNGMID